jgi:hypothetical protein
MTNYQLFSILVSLISATIALVSLYRTRRVSEIQVGLQKKSAELQQIGLNNQFRDKLQQLTHIITQNQILELQEQSAIRERESFFSSLDPAFAAAPQIAPFLEQYKRESKTLSDAVESSWKLNQSIRNDLKIFWEAEPITNILFQHIQKTYATYSQQLEEKRQRYEGIAQPFDKLRQSYANWKGA